MVIKLTDAEVAQIVAEEPSPATDEELDRAEAVGQALERAPAAIVDVSFRRSPRGINVTLRNGVRIFVPIDALGITALTKARDADLAEVEAYNDSCLVIDFPRVDEGFSLSGFLIDLFHDMTRIELKRDAGKRTSPKKATVARSNGRKGGRAKKSAAHRGK